MVKVLRRVVLPFVALPLGVALACAWPAAADDGGAARPYHEIPATDEAIAVDGVLDEPAWRQAARIELAYETRPAENGPAPVATECLLTYDRDHLYVAFRAHDPEPARIRARLADRDDAWSDDFVGVVLDTFNDERRAYEFFVNPLGAQMDLTYDDVNGNEDSSWDTIWDSAGRITELGFEVEMALPFSSLRFPRAAGLQTWGLDVLRFYPRGDRLRLSSNRQERGRSCYLCQLSKMVGFAAVTPGRNLEVNPTVTGSYLERRGGSSEGGFAGEEDGEGGLTVSWGMTPNLTLAGTVNPDFSQVEADAAQLDVNTQFALFFPERRPFFLEGADLFASPLQAVFTRNVADPAWGLKLTGKEGAHAIGVFAAEDELTNLTFPGSQGSSTASFDFASTDAVVRYRRDVWRRSAVGVLATSRAGGGYENRVYGVDGMFRFTDSDTLRVQALRSTTEYPDAMAADHGQPRGAFSDDAFIARYSHDERGWYAYATYEDLGAGFRADLGFMPQVDSTFLLGGAARVWWGKEGDWYNRIALGGDWDRREDQTGQLLEEETQVFVEVGGPRQSFLWLSPGTRKRHFNGVDFDQDFVDLWFEVQPAGGVYFELSAGAGDAIDFANARPGSSLTLEPSVRLDLGEHLRAQLSHAFRRLDVEGGRLFEANLTQLRLVYQFNLRAFVRAVVQHTDLVRDASLYAGEVEARTESLFNQLLFAYKVNPRTVLYLGYSDSFTRELDASLEQQNRGLFLKVGYAWVL